MNTKPKNYKRAQTKLDEKLVRALLPFVESYLKASNPVGDSDLYNEQPRPVSVTLGDCRRATSVLISLQDDEITARLRGITEDRDRRLGI